MGNIDKFFNRVSWNGLADGKIIVTLRKECSYPAISLLEERTQFMDIGVEKIEILSRPKHFKNESDAGVILLIYLNKKDIKSFLEALERLNGNPCILSAEPNYIIDTHILPNDRYFRYLWGMQNIKLPYAWDFVRGNKTVSVAIIDSGIDYRHPDIVDNLWIALDSRSINNGNFSFPVRAADAMDQTGHGTHVAGTVGAVGNNFVGVAGICWNIRLVSLKIGNATMDLAAAIRAIDFATEENIDIINASWGGYFYSDALKYAIENYEGLFVASAGNSASDNDMFSVYPSSFESENIISVAASDYLGRLASFSNYGAASVDIAAPGADILSTDIFGGYSYMDGTSMSAPHVAGAAALLKSFRPQLNALEIKNIMLSSVDRQSSMQGRILSGGILNVYKAMRSVL